MDELTFQRETVTFFSRTSASKCVSIRAAEKTLAETVPKVMLPPTQNDMLLKHVLPMQVKPTLLQMTALDTTASAAKAATTAETARASADHKKLLSFKNRLAA